jgi:hypothetical protein
MQGFQPVYSGNSLTQAYRSAGELMMQGAQVQARAAENVGNSIGGALQAAGGQIAKSRANNAKVPESQVKAAEARGVDFGPRERVSTGGSDSGIVQYKPITQQEFDRAIANQGKIATLQSENLNSQRTLLAVKEAGLRLESARSEMNLRDLGISAAPRPFPGQLYPASPLAATPSSATQTAPYGLNPASIYSTPPILPRLTSTANPR